MGELTARAGVARLSELGIERQALDPLADAAIQHPAVGNTPDPPSRHELREVLERAV